MGPEDTSVTSIDALARELVLHLYLGPLPHTSDVTSSHSPTRATKPSTHIAVSSIPWSSSLLTTLFLTLSRSLASHLPRPLFERFFELHQGSTAGAAPAGAAPAGATPAGAAPAGAAALGKNKTPRPPKHGESSGKSGFKSLMQILSAASFYLDHLDGRTPIVVITSLLSPLLSPQLAPPAASGMTGDEAEAVLPPPVGGEGNGQRARGDGDDTAERVDLVDELMQLLDIG